MIATLFPQGELDAINSSRGITLEWIQSQPQELKDLALLRLCKVVEAKPTLFRVIYPEPSPLPHHLRGTFTESAESVAERTGCNRKTVLRGYLLQLNKTF